MKRAAHKPLLLLFIICTLLLRAQYDPLARNIFLNQETQQVIDEWNIKHPSYEFHSSFRPYLISTLQAFHDSIIQYKHFTIKNFFLSKTLNEGPGKRNQYNFQFLPIADLQTGYDLLQNKSVNEMAGGLHAKLNINNDFTLEGNFVGGRVSYPYFTNSYVESSRLVPGMGLAYSKDSSSYTFSNFSGYMSYSPNRTFNFQLGQGKHFIGDGYRSLLLSDVANNYPYFRINTNIWHIQYNVWYTWMKDMSSFNGSKSSLRDKYSAMHYLSWNVWKSLNISVFENIIWQGSDTTRDRGFDVNYLNPIVFYRPQEYAVGSPDNAFIGLNASLKLLNSVKAYGQLALDEFYLKEIRAKQGWWANKQGWQVGLKYVDALKIKGLTLQLEYNQVRPYTYSHGAVSQNYAHYGQPLAHPMGANFKEYVGILTLRKGRWMFSAQGVYAIIGKDSLGNSNVGQNIFLSYTTRPYDYHHYTTQGVKTDFMQSDIRLTFFIVPQMNLRVELGYIQRSEVSPHVYELQNPYIYFGLKTSFWNFYRDF